MAWYYGTFSCGHEGRVNVIGPSKDRQWKIDRRFEGMCEECHNRHLEAEREKQNKEAKEKAEEMEFPALTGTEKQVNWGNTLRLKLADDCVKKANEILERRSLSYYEEYYSREKLSKKEAKEVLKKAEEIVDYIMLNKTEAKFFIDNRGNNPVTILARAYEEILKNEEKEEMKEIIDESTVAPSEVKHTGVVEIKYNEEQIEVVYEKNEDFILLVKSLRYKWNGLWSRRVSELTGSYKDRVAELGNKLLNAGFPILVLDEDIREKAITANYEVECDRWIQYKENNPELLLISWEGRDEKLYNTARKLKGSKWSKPYVTVNISNFAEVEEFAELYGFKFTEKANEYIEKYKGEFCNIPKVEVANSKKYVQKDGLEEILDSSREILDDLKED